MTPVGFEPTQLALVELESTPLDHSGKVSMVARGGLRNFRPLANGKQRYCSFRAFLAGLRALLARFTSFAAARVRIDARRRSARLNGKTAGKKPSNGIAAAPAAGFSLLARSNPRRKKAPPLLKKEANF